MQQRQQEQEALARWQELGKQWESRVAIQQPDREGNLAVAQYLATLPASAQDVWGIPPSAVRVSSLPEERNLSMMSTDVALGLRREMDL